MIVFWCKHHFFSCAFLFLDPSKFQNSNFLIQRVEVEVSLQPTPIIFILRHRHITRPSIQQQFRRLPLANNCFLLSSTPSP